jgi:hypothetical protein
MVLIIALGTVQHMTRDDQHGHDKGKSIKNRQDKRDFRHATHSKNSQLTDVRTPMRPKLSSTMLTEKKNACHSATQVT